MNPEIIVYLIFFGLFFIYLWMREVVDEGIL